MGAGWIGVDLDGTLAHYDGWKGERHIGPPVPAMMDRVRAWLAEGREVRIMTARVSSGASGVRHVIGAWLEENDLPQLEITCVKDYGMIELWDDRAVTVELNTGRVICHPVGEATP